MRKKIPNEYAVTVQIQYTVIQYTIVVHKSETKFMIIMGSDETLQQTVFGSFTVSQACFYRFHGTLKVP